MRPLCPVYAEGLICLCCENLARKCHRRSARLYRIARVSRRGWLIDPFTPFSAFIASVVVHASEFAHGACAARAAAVFVPAATAAAAAAIMLSPSLVQLPPLLLSVPLLLFLQQLMLLLHAKTQQQGAAEGSSSGRSCCCTADAAPMLLLLLHDGAAPATDSAAIVVTHSWCWRSCSIGLNRAQLPQPNNVCSSMRSRHGLEWLLSSPASRFNNWQIQWFILSHPVLGRESRTNRWTGRANSDSLQNTRLIYIV